MTTFKAFILMAVIIIVLALLTACQSDEIVDEIVVDNTPDWSKRIYLINMECNSDGEACHPLIHPDGHIMPLTSYWNGEDCFESSQVIGKAYRGRLKPGHNVWAQCNYIKSGINDVLPYTDIWEVWDYDEVVWLRAYAHSQAQLQNSGGL